MTCVTVFDMLLSSNVLQPPVYERYHDAFPRNAGADIIPKFLQNYVKQISEIENLFQAPLVMAICATLAASAPAPAGS